MNAIDTYFDKIFCINLDRSDDRWRHVEQEAARFGFTKIERFRGYDFHEWDGLPDHLRVSMNSAMCGCSHSHAGIFHLISHNRWDKVLVLEDDFEILHNDFLTRFEEYMREVPPDWDIVYLGAHYGEVPTERISEHVVRAGYIKTTSSYAIRGRHARRMSVIIGTQSGPDDILSGYNPHCNAYVLHPRLMGQYENVSSIWGKRTWNTLCMTEVSHDRHVNALPITQRK